MSQSTGPQNLTNQDSLDINGPLQNFREVGYNFPGTQLIIKKANPKDDDGTFYIIQVRFAIEEEMCLWATSKMMNRLQKQQTAKVTCIQETMVN